MKAKDSLNQHLATSYCNSIWTDSNGRKIRSLRFNTFHSNYITFIFWSCKNACISVSHSKRKELRRNACNGKVQDAASHWSDLLALTADTVKQLYCFCLTYEAIFLFLPDIASKKEHFPQQQLFLLGQWSKTIPTTSLQPSINCSEKCPWPKDLHYH